MKCGYSQTSAGQARHLHALALSLRTNASTPPVPGASSTSDMLTVASRELSERQLLVSVGVTHQGRGLRCLTSCLHLALRGAAL